MDTRFQESLQTQLLYLKQENTQGLSSSGAGTGEPRGNRGERAWGRRGLRRSRNALVACKRCTLRANSACAQVPKTVLMCARSHKMHLSKTLTDVFTEDLLCSREPGQQQGGLGPGGPLSGRQPDAAAEAPSRPTPPTTALLLGNQTGQQAARVKHMSTATLVGRSHSRRELGGRAAALASVGPLAPGVHLVTRPEPRGETSASSRLGPTASEPGCALGRSRRPTLSLFSVIRVARANGTFNRLSSAQTSGAIRPCAKD